MYLLTLGASDGCYVSFFGLDSMSTAVKVVTVLAALCIVILLIAIVIRKIRKKKRTMLWVCLVLVTLLTTAVYSDSIIHWSSAVMHPEHVAALIHLF